MGLVHEPALFIYNLTDFAKSCRGAQGSDNFSWEAQLESVLRRTVRIVANPRHARLFFVPVCLSTVWWTLCNQTNSMPDECLHLKFDGSHEQSGSILASAQEIQAYHYAHDVSAKAKIRTLSIPTYIWVLE